MTDDLVKRLRDFDPHNMHEWEAVDLAADRIEQLVQEKREAALDAIAAYGQAHDAYEAQLKAEALLDTALEAVIDAKLVAEAKLAEVEKERDALKVTYDDIYADAMSDAESDAQDFESDLWKGVRSLLDDLGFDWSGDVQFDGVPAADAVQFLRDALDGETARAEAAEAKLVECEARLGKAVDALELAVIRWDEHQKYGIGMSGDWVDDARTTLAEIEGEKKDE